MPRLILAILCLLQGLLCVFPAPEYHLWYVSILTTEFPWVFMAVIIALLAWGLAVKKYRSAGAVVCLVAFALFLYPVISAYSISGKLQQNFETAFGPGSWQQNGRQPFSFLNMFTALTDKQVPFATMPYTTTPDGPLTIDYYKAEQTGMQPCVIVVHGGSWSAGDSRQLPELNSYLAEEGYNVASINYRLAPQNKWPAPIDDVHAAFGYIRAHANELGVDTNNFVLLGRSAGGQIVLNVAYAQQENGLKGVIDFYGPADMVWGYANPASPLVLNTCKVMEDYLGGTYAQVPQNYAASSATETATAQSVPTLIIQGKNDPLVSYIFAERLDKKLNSAGVKHMLLSLPWATHGCDYTLHGPSGQLTTFTIMQFLNFVTHQPVNQKNHS